MQFYTFSFITLFFIGYKIMSFVEDKNLQTESITLGRQIWMQKNLNISTFRNGDSIPEVKSAEEWVTASSKKEPAWCYYDNKEKNSVQHGKLYNWYAINDSRGLAPEGWRIPSNQDWNELIDFLGGEQIAIIKMKSTKEWKMDGNGDNSSGFSAFPSGYRDFSGSFKTKGWFIAFWSSEENNPNDAWVRSLFYSGKIEKNGFPKASGFSVRCVKNID